MQLKFISMPVIDQQEALDIYTSLLGFEKMDGDQAIRACEISTIGALISIFGAYNNSSPGGER